MAFFNSYVKLPEGSPLNWLGLGSISYADQKLRCRLQQLLSEILCRSACGTFGAWHVGDQHPLVWLVLSIQLIVHWWFQTPFCFLMLVQTSSTILGFFGMMINWWVNIFAYIRWVIMIQRVQDLTHGVLPPPHLTLPTGSASRKGVGLQHEL